MLGTSTLAHYLTQNPINMKKQLLILLLFCSINFINSQNVNIPDANFKAYLVGNSSINTNGDTEIQVSEANAFSGAINCTNQNISDLTGIEAFTNLTDLRCALNNLTVLDVSQNTVLTILSANANNLTTLDVSQNPNLAELFCSQSSNLSTLDVSQNTNLKELDISETNISSIDVSQNTNLELLNINSNFTALDISNNTALKELNLAFSNVTSLDLTNNTALEVLFIFQSNISALDLSQNISLNTLQCQQATNLTELNLKNLTSSMLTNFSAINCPNLTCIQVDDIADATANWTDIDATASFSTNCNPLAIGDSFVDNFITYEITSLTPNEVKTIDYSTTGSTMINIPVSVTNNAVAFDVTTIGMAAFLQKGLTSVQIPSSVTSIESAAFFGNTNLTSLTLQDGIVSIGNNAFNDCDLTTITIPSTVTNIGDSAFNSNNQLTCIVSEATTPPTVTTGSSDSFGTNRSNIDLSIPSGTASAYTSAGWTGFNTVAEGLTGTFVINNITYQINPTPNNEVSVTDYSVAGGTSVNIPTTVNSGCTEFSVVTIAANAFMSKNIASVVFPNNLVSIEDNAFNNNDLTTVNLPNGVTSIGDNAFFRNDIASLNIPGSVLTIGEGAFRSNDLTAIIIPDGVTNIGFMAFAQNLATAIIIPDSVTSIGGFAFWQNSITDLSNVTLPNGTTNIPDGFLYENSINNLTIPNGITSIGEWTFAENGITSLTLPASLIHIGEIAFEQNQLTNVMIPNGVLTISERAFRYNQLTTIVIPGSVTTIGDRAFLDNPLTDVYAQATTPPTITTGGITDTFSTNRGAIHLHIPSGTLDTYVTNPNAGADWSGFNPVTEDASLSTSNFELEHGIKVITNRDELKIISSRSATLKNVYIYDITGKKVKQNSDEIIIPINDLSSGIYILKLTFEEGTLVKKFAK